jgi:hypothetical protein
MIPADEIGTARCTAALRARMEAAGIDLGGAVRFDDLLDLLFAHFAATARCVSAGFVYAEPPGSVLAPKVRREIDGITE